MSVRIIMSGIGGYAATYLESLLPAMDSGEVKLVGAADPNGERSDYWTMLAERQVAIGGSFEKLLGAGLEADLAIIASPIQFHCDQTLASLERGMYTLCEKPAAATLEEVRRMAAARDSSRRGVAIGYQWSYSSAVQRLKADIAAGRLGRPKRLRTRVSWPRDAAYYSRNNWAGRIRDEAGRPVNDSPVNNATAHYLHNMFYILGMDGLGSELRPATLEAELYRANATENYDTAALRLTTADDVEMMFFTSHAVDHGESPIFSYEFEDGVVSYGTDQSEIVARMANGTEIRYGDPNFDGTRNKIMDTIEKVRSGRQDTLCSLEDAAMHTRVVDALQEMETHVFSVDVVQEKLNERGSRQVFVPGLFSAIALGYERGELFSEMDMPWAVAAQRGGWGL